MRLKSPATKPTHHPNQKVNLTCISCGDQIDGNYCANCGEKRFDVHDLTLKHFAEESFEGITHFDNKFFKSVKILFTRPGLLSENYCQGMRVAFMRPFALFFVSNLLFFFIIGPFNIFSIPMDSFYHQEPYTNFHTKEIIGQLANNEESYLILARIFNEKMGVQSKAFLVFFIPFMALGGLVMRRKTFLSAHLVFSTHYFSFIILYYTITYLLVAKVFYYLTNQSWNSTFDLTYSMVSLLIFMAYYGLAVNRFYKVSKIKAAFGAIVTALLFLITLYGYRFLLFYKIINAIKIDQ